MKKLRNVLLPAIIVLMGAGAAFATNSDKSSNDLVAGYSIGSSNECQSVSVQCSTSGSAACTWTDKDGVEHNLFMMINETTCGNPLYRP